MAEQWATFIPSVSGLIGVLAGIFVGRWQVTHQARVEHGQWLRGQRQEAHLALLDAWVTCVKEFREMVDRNQVQVEHHLAETHSGNGWQESEDRIWEQTEAIAEPVRNALERVGLLGPKSVDAACTQLRAALNGLTQATRLEAGDPRWPKLTACEAAWDRADAARLVFLTACRKATWTAPNPSRQRG
ncbi:hypothetical protein AB0I75_32475 [Streptomyces sp. NPDC050273]|uniref:hypothetical protein n=1 Tax=Streptomyces sp. NPDC050273 TaxID=3154933 RepID=UPI00342821F9